MTSPTEELKKPSRFKEPGMPLSLGLHAAVLMASIVTFSSPKKFEDVSEAVSVEVIDESAIREVSRGERTAPQQPTPAVRVDRQADKPEQNPQGVAARQVDTVQPATRQEATAKEERKEQTALVVPPPPLPVPRPQPPKPAEPPKAAAVPTPAPKPTPSEEEEEEAEEAIRQAAKKREEQRKQEEARKREEQRKVDETKRQEALKQEQQKERERLQQMAAQEQAKAEQQKREQEDARKREDAKKLADAKAAEDRKKAEEAKKAQEAAKKAADEKRKRDAEQEAKNQAASDAARRALLASREPAQNSGNTGQQVNPNPARGAPTATGQKLNPSERAALAGLLADQIRSCWSVPVSGKPSQLPQVRVALNQDGSLSGAPTLINSSGDPNFRALAESGMRAIRQCAPFRIPSRFQPTYNDWRSIAVQLNPDD